MGHSHRAGERVTALPVYLKSLFSKETALGELRHWHHGSGAGVRGGGGQCLSLGLKLTNTLLLYINHPWQIRVCVLSASPPCRDAVHAPPSPTETMQNQTRPLSARTCPASGEPALNSPLPDPYVPDELHGGH